MKFMRTWLWGMFRYLHLTLGMAEALGIQNPKQNMKPQCGDLVQGLGQAGTSPAAPVPVYPELPSHGHWVRPGQSLVPSSLVGSPLISITCAGHRLKG